MYHLQYRPNALNRPNYLISVYLNAGTARAAVLPWHLQSVGELTPERERASAYGHHRYLTCRHHNWPFRAFSFRNARFSSGLDASPRPRPSAPGTKKNPRPKKTESASFKGSVTASSAAHSTDHTPTAPPSPCPALGTPFSPPCGGPGRPAFLRPETEVQCQR